MSHNDDSRLLFMGDSGEQLHHLPTTVTVESSSGLISENHAWPIRQCPCDGDTLLALVDQTGVACHTGRHNCFFRAMRGGVLSEIAPIEIDMDKETA